MPYVLRPESTGRSSGDQRSIRLGPTATRLLARRRRWVRWLAVALACLTALPATWQLHHRPAPRRAGVVVVIAEHVLRPGQLIRSSDLRTAVQEAPVVGAAPFAHPEDAVGRVAVRGLAVGDPVTPANTASVLRYYGVAARVPRGMRALNLTVPPAAAFGGELAPGTGVDLIGAFTLGQDRSAAALLSTEIVLRTAHGRVVPSAPASRLGAASGAADQQQALPVEIEVAVPASREREVALAQAFGRIFVAVHSFDAVAPGAGPSGSLDLRRYLGLPQVTAPTPAVPQVPRIWLPGTFMGPKTGSPAPTPTPPASNRAIGSPRAAEPRPVPPWAVEVILWTQRALTQVPRLDGIPAPPRPPARDGQ